MSGTALGDGNKTVGKKSKKFPAFRELAMLGKNEDIDNWLSVSWKMKKVSKKMVRDTPGLF